MNKKSIFIPLVIVFIFSLLLLERIYYKYPLEFFNLFLFTLVYSFPIIISFIFGERYLNKNPGSKSIIWRMPLYSIIPALISAFFAIVLFFSIVRLSGEAAIGAGIIILGTPVIFVITYLILSFFMAIILDLNNKSFNLMLIVISVLLILFSIIYSSIYVHSCGTGGCIDSEYLALMAQKHNDYSICERGRSEHTDYTSGPRFAVSGITKKGNIPECYVSLAILEKDPLLCDYANVLWRKKCFENFVKQGILVECEKMVEKDSRYICYYVYAFALGDKNLCNKIGTYDKLFVPLPTKGKTGLKNMYERETCISRIEFHYGELKRSPDIIM